MFDFDKFGQRLQDARKKKGMTQEELAIRMGISAQAVSKWETGLSYPDITTIPTLAALLDMDIAELFGQEAKTKTKASRTFADFHNGLPLIHEFKNVACYSDKSIASAKEDIVTFVDGSSADLVTMKITYKGKGEIHLENKNDSDVPRAEESIGREEYVDSRIMESIEAQITCCDVEIMQSKDSNTRVIANGEREFLETLDVTFNNDTLKIFNANYSKQSRNSHKKNKLKIELPCEAGNKVEIRIEGQGTVNSTMSSFKTAELIVSGSGTFDMKDFSESCMLKISGSGVANLGNSKEIALFISGSGVANCQNADKAQLNITGSGVMNLNNTRDVKSQISGSGAISVTTLQSINMQIAGSGSMNIGEMTGGDFNVSIAGKGGIDIGKGNCDNFNLMVDGDCDVDADGLTARKAHITLEKKGKVTLGRVIESSIEQIKKKGRITVLARGNE